MKLSVWANYFHDMSAEQMVQAFSKSGFECIEMSTEHAEELIKRGDPSKVGPKFKSYSDEYGLNFPQGHLKLKSDICSKNSREEVDELKKWLDLFMEIGVKAAVLHSGGSSINDITPPEVLLEMRKKAIGELSSHIKGSDIVICLENLIHTTKDCLSLLEIIDAVGSSNIGICLDTGHLNIHNGDQAAFIRQAGEYLKAIHIADNEGERDQHLMPYGCGTVKWDKVMKALREISYEGLFNLEIPGETRAPMEIRLAKLEYIKMIYQYLIKI